MVIPATTKEQQYKNILTSKKKLDKAGEEYKLDTTDSYAREHINYYRLLRLNGLKEVLDEVLFSVSYPKNFIIAARLKRLKSIARKLQREGSMRLSRMDDIIGIRLVCESVRSVSQLSNELIKSSKYYNKKTTLILLSQQATEEYI